MVVSISPVASTRELKRIVSLFESVKEKCTVRRWEPEDKAEKPEVSALRRKGFSAHPVTLLDGRIEIVFGACLSIVN